MALEFKDRVRSIMSERNISAKDLGSWIETEEDRRNKIQVWRNVENWTGKRASKPSLERAVAIARALGVTVEYLITGENGHQSNLQVVESQEEDPEICRIMVLDQRVAAGHGQEFVESTEAVKSLPFLRRMLRGADPSTARALEVRGDSMTGIQLFDGDMIVFVPGSIRGDGIYVLRVNDTLIVKRVEFDEISRKLRIMSENPRYPDRVESADGQTVEVIGKVYGWLHAHPY